MKRGWKAIAALRVLTLAGMLLADRGDCSSERALEETRRSLRQQGFKLELREFQLSSPPEVSRRAALLGATTLAAITNRWRPAQVAGRVPGLLNTTIGKDAAAVVWHEERLPDAQPRDLWPALRERFQADQTRLEFVRQAALAGPIRFEPIGSQGPDPLLPYLADVKNLETLFDWEAMLALRDAKRGDAWTNLLAATCLVTAYEPEPIDISHLVRFACATLAYAATWNALQAHGWRDEQLADLQRRWELVDFWHGLPETAAYARACAAAQCELERRRPLRPVIPLKQVLQFPAAIGRNLNAYWTDFRYRHGGSYRDEEALLLYYRDRELELRRAVLCPTWSEMRRMPGVTNHVPLPRLYPSGVAARLNSRMMVLAAQTRGLGLLARAAEAESRRRLIVTAIALERYHGRHDSYPTSLPALVPEWLKAAPLDLMDGQPLRYRLTDDGHFVLYSVGLDGVDDGGDMRLRSRNGSTAGVLGPGFEQAPDLVWPRPASAEEVARLRREQQQADQARQEALRDSLADEGWRRTARRQAKVNSILAAPVPSPSREAVDRGQLLSDALRNEKTAGTNHLTLHQMLTLKPLITGAEPETVTFELPVDYNSLTNLGELVLCIDPCKDEDSDEGCQVGQMECRRAGNGNTLLVWNTIFDAPGKHALQAVLTLDDARSAEEICGPLSPFVVSNLCQFSLASAHFEPEYGVRLDARLQERKGNYTIEFKTTTGERVKTITGRTSNGSLKVHWDLRDEHGQTRTNQEFVVVAHVTLPDSGRSQVLRGP